MDFSEATYTFQSCTDCGETVCVRLRARQSFGRTQFTVADQGQFLWPAAEVLSQFLVDHGRQESLHGRRVLELGAGVGLVSCVALKSLSPVSLVATDFDESTVHILRQNLTSNQSAETWPQASACMLDWRFVTANASGKLSVNERRDIISRSIGALLDFDLLMGSDLFWDEEHTELILATVAELLRITDAKKPRCVLSFVARSDFLMSYFHRTLGMHDLAMRELAVENPAPVKVTEKIWTKPQPIYVVNLVLKSDLVAQ
ncbi:hypothetical protein HDU83_006653 [Entophlyctis luteolus]|nr:hypothetical protein HDU83_006653 [Entophlyctis luteolus]